MQEISQQYEIQGFSKLSKLEKINLLSEKFLNNSEISRETLKRFWHPDEKTQKVFDDFSENTLTNYFLPFGVVPNLEINGKIYCAPMAIEESSVVAAAARSANYWLKRGGFKAEVIGTKKEGQVHLEYTGKKETLYKLFEKNLDRIYDELIPVMSNMQKRGGGMTSLVLVDKTQFEPNYYQIHAQFETCDAMGANFINTVLETIAKTFKSLVNEDDSISSEDKNLNIIMSILSNYTPECLVKVTASCPVNDLADKNLGMTAQEFAHKFCKAVRIAGLDVYRATTHNKGIFNGIDAVVIATGNDFRAVEACGHAYASRSGYYRSLSTAKVVDDQFIFELEIPMALGTVGGLTSLHPLAKLGLDILGNPSAKELMMVAAAVGLAQNFGAVRSLVTTGIQKGHMKMHLMNILNHLEANDIEREEARVYFEERIISFNDVRAFIASKRNVQ